MVSRAREGVGTGSLDRRQTRYLNSSVLHFSTSYIHLQLAVSLPNRLQYMQPSISSKTPSMQREALGAAGQPRHSQQCPDRFVAACASRQRCGESKDLH